MPEPSTEVVILAQGTQSRLGRDVGFKQLLQLPACGGVQIMGRTITQCTSFVKPWDIMVVTWPEIWQEWSGSLPPRARPAMMTLADPGNSSLKGIARYLECDLRRAGMFGPRPDRTVVLLGDTVYSWECLSALFEAAADWGFVGTPDLSASSGELWGVAWHRSAEDRMLTELRDALARHPPFEGEYQPGQMRRWISGWRRGDIVNHVDKLRRHGHYTDISDYTHDIDIPAHITLLPWLSEAAAADDAQHGLVWPGVST
jgi:hypothetical protein